MSRGEGSNNIWLSGAFSNATEKPGRVILYGYDSNEETGSCYTMQGIFSEAEGLLNKLLELRTLAIMVCMGTCLPICAI